jgi:ribonuclease BN (tRNA processing enzyme)
VRGGDSTFAYVPDALDANDEAILELAADADVLIRGAPFVLDESERAAAFDHGTAEVAAAIAKRARVRQLVLTHHAPARSDAAVYDIAKRVGATAATEGMMLVL